MNSIILFFLVKKKGFEQHHSYHYIFQSAIVGIFVKQVEGIVEQVMVACSLSLWWSLKLKLRRKHQTSVNSSVEMEFATLKVKYRHFNWRSKLKVPG